MMTTLYNDQLRVACRPLGAELISVFHEKQAREYIWQADPAVWGWHAPLLFPVVGQLRHDRYELDGQTYQMPKHGFARRRTFELVEQTPTRLVWQLAANDDTLAVYPFRFVLHVGYTLTGNTVMVDYYLTHQDDAPMWFSIGAHPAFALPEAGAVPYEIVAEQPETAPCHQLADGLYSGQVTPGWSGKVLPLTPGIFDDDALVFQELRAQSLVLRHPQTDYRVQMDFAGFPYFALWAKPQAPFVCLEPWYGLADYVHHDGDLTRKRGICRLEPGQAFTAHYRLTFGTD